MATNKVDPTSIELSQGHTYSRVLRWGTEPVVRIPISTITCPLGLARIGTTIPHGMIDGWTAAVTGVQGMRQINAADPNNLDPKKDWHTVRVIDASTIELADLDVSDFKPYTSDGFIRYNTPVDLTNISIVFRMRTKEGGPVIASNLLADAPNNILDVAIDTVAHTILHTVPSTASAILGGKSGWYDVDAHTSDVPPVVTQLAQGPMKVRKE